MKEKTTFHFVDLPVRLFYAFPVNDDFSIFAFAGPKFQFGIAGKTAEFINDKKVEQANVYTGTTTLYDFNGNVIFKGDTGVGIKRFNIMAGAGVGLKYKSFLLKGGYDFGLLNIAPKDVTNVTGHISQWYVSLGYAF